MTSDLVLPTSDLMENPTARTPVVLCLDTSASMQGDPIDEMRKGVELFYEEVGGDEIARYSAEIAVVTFGGDVRVIADLAERASLNLQAAGNTPMGEAVCAALDILERRKRKYQDTGVDYFQPWLILMTDGMPTDDIAKAAERVSGMVDQRKLSVFPIGVGAGADMDTLGRFSPRRSPLRLRGLSFRSFFEWLSQSVQRVSASIPGERVPLDEEGIKGWGEV